MVCFVILHYMALEETIQCVESILNNIEGDKKVIVVDNCSPNNTGADLEKRYTGSIWKNGMPGPGMWMSCRRGRTSDLPRGITSAMVMLFKIMIRTLWS